MFSLPTSKVIFARILDKSSKDGVTHLVNSKDLVEDNVRADTPDSGGGGYFTLSESDTGSTLGKESPNPSIKRCNDIYRISKSYSDAQDNSKNRRIKTTLIGHSEIKKNNREPQSKLCLNNQNKLPTKPFARTMLPPRPPRASSELPPPVPKKFPSKKQHNGGETFFHRNVNIPDQQPLKRVLPLQIQSPSMMKTFQKASSTEDLHNGSTSARFSNASKTQFNSAKENKTYLKNSNSFSTSKDPSRNPTKFPEFSQVNSNPKDKKGVKQTEVRKSIIQKDFQANNFDINSQKSYLSLVRMRKNEVCLKIETESLASRAKRRSEEKVKKNCKNICFPPHNKNVKSPKYTATLSKPTKSLQRYSSTSSASSCSSEKEKDDKQLPKQPVNSLIRVYDKSFEDKISIKQEQNIYAQKKNNNIKNDKHINAKYSKEQKTENGKIRSSEIPLKENTPIITNSIDEFLKSVKRTKLKYQDMLNNNDEKGSDTSLEVKTDPTDSDLQTGCFTDVSYSGYFAVKKLPETMSRNMSMSEGSSATCEKDPKQIHTNVEFKKGTYMMEETILQKQSQEDNEIFKNFENKKIFETDTTPTPSPRIKKRLRREQFLQEHKQMGKEVLALAKTSTNKDLSIGNDPVLHQETYYVKTSDTLGQTESEIKKVNAKNDSKKLHQIFIQDKSNINENIQFDHQDNIRQILAIKEKEIMTLKHICDKLEEEKGNSILVLKQTQVMSTEQLEKLFDLEKKQDLLEIENTQTSDRLIESENKNRDLDKQCKILQQESVTLQSEALNLTNKLKEIEEESRFDETREFTRLKESNKDYDKKLILMEEENMILKEEIISLKSDQNDLYNQQDQKSREHHLEIQSIKNEHEKLKRTHFEQMRNLENQLKKSQEEKDKCFLEKRQFEEQISKFAQLDYEEIIAQLKLDLKQMKLLLKCSQEEQKENPDESVNAKMIKTLKNQIEEVESERDSAIRQNKSLDLDLLYMQDQKEQLCQEKTKLENKYCEIEKENLSFTSIVQENEAELEDIMKKYKSSVAAVSSQQVILQNQSCAIIDLEKEKIKLVEEVSELSTKLEILENENINCDKQKRFEIKNKDLEQKLEMEVASRQRSETIIGRLKKQLEISAGDAEAIKQENSSKADINRQLVRQLKDLKEDNISLKIKETATSEKKNTIEKKLEISVAEMLTLHSQLQLANDRIEHLQSILTSDSDSDCCSLLVSDGADDDLDIFLQNHRKMMAEQKEEEIRIRENIKESMDTNQSKHVD